MGNIFKGVSALPIREMRGFRSQSIRSLGPDSLLLYLPTLAARKLLGTKRVSKAFWKYWQKPALSADIVAGKALGKIPGLKGLFTLKEEIPWGKKMLKQVERPSGLAPLIKTRDIAAPIIIGVGLEKGLKGIRKQVMDQPTREKVAAAMLQLNGENKEHRKRAHAIRLLYKQSEMGYGHVPQTYKELEEKLASLMGQDLNVVEKALELTGGNLRMGELASAIEPSSYNASEKFQVDILGD